MKEADALPAPPAFQISGVVARLVRLAYQTSAAVVHHARPADPIKVALVAPALLVDQMGDRPCGNRRR